MCVGGLCKKKDRRRRKRIPSANLFRNVTFLRASCSLISLGESFFTAPSGAPPPPPPLSAVHRLPPSDFFRAASTIRRHTHPGQVKCCNIQIARTVTFLRVSSPEEQGWGKSSREWKERREWALRRARERARKRESESERGRKREGVLERARWSRVKSINAPQTIVVKFIFLEIEEITLVALVLIPPPGKTSWHVLADKLARVSFLFNSASWIREVYAQASQVSANFYVRVTRQRFSTGLTWNAYDYVF